MANVPGFITEPMHYLPAIYEHTMKLIEIFAPNGNYIFNQVHNILDNVSPEKVITIYQAALDYRKTHPYK